MDNRRLIVLFHLFIAMIAQAQTPDIGDNTAASWPGQWIALDQRPVPEYSAELEGTPWIWFQSNRRVRPDLLNHSPVAYFRKSFEVEDPEAIQSAVCYITADHVYHLYLNQEAVHTNDAWWKIDKIHFQKLQKGTNQLAIRVENRPIEHENLRPTIGNPAGLILRLVLTHKDGTVQKVRTDSSWRVHPEGPDGWTEENYDDSEWTDAGEMLTKGILQWQAQDPLSNRWYCYRKTIELQKLPETMPARIAVDSKYWLWINGELVVFEGGVKRGPDPDNTYYDPIDLRPYFKTGTNTVAILAWYWGRHGFSHNSSGQHGLYLDMDTGSGTVSTDRTWKVRRYPAYRKSAPPYPNYRLPEFNIHFDAREDIGDWIQPGYDDSGWSNATELGNPPVEPWGGLYDRMIPQWSDSGLIAYSDAPEFPMVSNGDPVVVSLPYNAMVTPYFKIRAEAGQLIDLRMDNYIGGSEYNIRSEYVTRDGEQAFEALAWMNGHKVIYSFPEGIEILDLKYRETAFDAPIRGSFFCDNPQLNELWKRSLRTLLVCMRDTYYDCPDRERAQWWGDAVIEIGQTFYALDRVVDTLTQKAILELVNWQRADNTLYSPVPAGNWNSELPGQMLMSIGEFGFWTYYLHTADKETVQAAYPRLRPYLELWDMDTDGLVENRQGEWYWGDWGTNKDTRILDNCLYALALLGVDKLAELTGNHEDRPFYQERYASIKANFDRIFWTGTEYRSSDYTEETDDRGHGLAVLAGLTDSANHDLIAKVLEESYQASPYMEKYILEALFRMGRTEQAIDRMLTRYKPHLETDFTTLFEGWGIGSEGFGGGTINHSWSGGPLTLLSQYVAGIEPLTPGYERFRINPSLGQLSRVEAVVPSVAGEIRSTVHLQDGRVFQEVTVPPGTTAEVWIPLPEGTRLASLEVNGQQVSEDASGKEQGVLDYSYKSGQPLLNLAGGKYVIDAEAKAL